MSARFPQGQPCGRFPGSASPNLCWAVCGNKARAEGGWQLLTRAKIRWSFTLLILVAPKGAVFFKKGFLVETDPLVTLINVKRFGEWIS